MGLGAENAGFSGRVGAPGGGKNKRGQTKFQNFRGFGGGFSFAGNPKTHGLGGEGPPGGGGAFLWGGGGGLFFSGGGPVGGQGKKQTRKKGGDENLGQGGGGGDGVVGFPWYFVGDRNGGPKKKTPLDRGKGAGGPKKKNRMGRRGRILGAVVFRTSIFSFGPARGPPHPMKEERKGVFSCA